jgi:hypothetical protein
MSLLPNGPHLFLFASGEQNGAELLSVINTLNNKHSIALVLDGKGVTVDLGSIFMYILVHSEMAEELQRSCSFAFFNFTFKDDKLDELTMNGAAVNVAYSTTGMTAKDVADAVMNKYETPSFELGGKIIDSYYKILTSNGENYFIYQRDNFVRLKNVSTANF